MGKIFCLMGKSASGKDYVYRTLLAQDDIKLKHIVPYTTRPIRIGEADGVNYHFCMDEEAREMERSGRVIEMRSYDTACGIWKYFTADDGQIDLERDDYLMIGTLEAYERIRDYFGGKRVVPIYIWVEDGERLARALRRERKQEEPKYAEMCRRFLADEKDFSAKKLEQAGIERKFENIEKEQIVADIRAYIEEKRE